MDMQPRINSDIKDTEKGKEVINMNILSVNIPISNNTNKIYTGDTLADKVPSAIVEGVIHRIDEPNRNMRNYVVNDSISSSSSNTNAIMTPEEFAERMNALDKGDYSRFDPTVNPENVDEQHMEADKLMANLLESLGYEEGVETFWMMDKYYI